MSSLSGTRHRFIGWPPLLGLERSPIFSSPSLVRLLAAAAQLSNVVRLARRAASLSAWWLGDMKFGVRRSTRVLLRWLNDGRGWCCGMLELVE